MAQDTREPHCCSILGKYARQKQAQYSVIREILQDIQEDIQAYDAELDGRAEILYGHINMTISGEVVTQDTLTLSASQFKAHCLQFLRALEARKHTRIIVTRRGKPIAELTHPQTPVPQLHGALRGSVCIAQDVDLTAPVMAEPLDAEQGILHR